MKGPTFYGSRDGDIQTYNTLDKNRTRLLKKAKDPATAVNRFLYLKHTYIHKNKHRNKQE